MKKEDLTNKTFGRWVVLELYGSDRKGKRLWKCFCSCGNPEHKLIRTETLKRGSSKSCGCLKNEKTKERMTKHGMRDHPDYKVWLNMRNRCNNHNSDDYSYYGGRGISVCEDWNDFAKFIEDMGVRPSSEYSIDRKNGDGNYCKENCRWARQVEQVRNLSMKSTNTSGVTGVHLGSRATNGTVYLTWFATWCELDGKNNRKGFSVLKYGYDKAKELAIEYRNLKIFELNNNGAGYTDRHGK